MKKEELLKKVTLIRIQKNKMILVIMINLLMTTIFAQETNLKFNKG